MRGKEMTKMIQLRQVLFASLFLYSLNGVQSKAYAQASSERSGVRTYYSPDRKFSIEETQDHVEFVDKATGRRTTIDLIGHMMGKPVFSTDSSGFVIPAGTASMGVWPQFYKRDNSSGILEFGPPLDPDGEPTLVWER
jgi:hypothetical protein